MHPTLSPALVRTRAARGPVAIMIRLKSLKSGAEIEWGSLEPFGGLELKTAQAAAAPSSFICPTTCRGSDPRWYGALPGRCGYARCTTLARHPSRRRHHGPAPGSGRGEAPAVVPHPPTPGGVGVGGGLGGARSSLAMPKTPPTPAKRLWVG
jgi:hypothetical protein